MKINPINSPLLPTFFYYAIPSMLGLIAISSASIVDGVFIGNWVGPEALAAVNLTIPYQAFMFSFLLMFSIGGTVRAGKYRGEKRFDDASSVFTKTVVVVTCFSLFISLAAWFHTGALGKALGANDELLPLVVEYLNILLLFMPVQLIGIAIYFFVRMDEQPVLASVALICGSVANIVLDWFFITCFEWELTGAAWATGLSQLLQSLILLFHFVSGKGRFKWLLLWEGWSEIPKGAINGFSEFINEVSGSLTHFMINWLLMIRIGVIGLAAFTVINYIIFFAFMIFYSLGDAIQILVSQNYGAQQFNRIRKFIIIALATSSTIAIMIMVLLALAPERLIGVFLSGDVSSTLSLAKKFAMLILPVFLFSGINFVASSYFTAIHKPLESGAIALSRGLIFPASLLALFGWVMTDIPLLAALPIAEIITSILSVTLMLKHLRERSDKAV